MSISSHYNIQHGHYNTPLYRVWASMKQRCQNPKNKEFHNYGGRGIKVCDRWRDSFILFYRDVGERPLRASLDRINNDGDYEPGNFRWSSQKEQSRNSRLASNVTSLGQTLCLTDWSEITGIKVSTLSYRIRKGIPPGIALTALNRRQLDALIAEVKPQI